MSHRAAPPAIDRPAQASDRLAQAPAAGPAAAAPGHGRVFVYGTLRAGGSNDIARLGLAAPCLGAAQVRGRLFHLGAYPGLRLGGPDWVRGEVYRLTPDLELRLDAIEEVWPQRTGEYLKHEALVQMTTGPWAPGLLRCMLYELHPLRVQGRPCIASGDWLAVAGRRP